MASVIKPVMSPTYRQKWGAKKTCDITKSSSWGWIACICYKSGRNAKGVAH